MKTPLRTILCPSDLSPTGDAAVAAASTLLAPGGTLHLLHVWEPAYVLSPLDATPVVMLPSTPEQDEAREKSVDAHLERLLPSDVAAPGVRAQVHVVKDSDAVGTILREADRLGADAIVMGTHGRSGLGRALMGSVASDVLKRAKIPVLLVKDPAAATAEKAEKSSKRSGAKTR